MRPSGLRVAQIALGYLLGAGLLALLASRAGLSNVTAALRGSMRWVPLMMLCDALRAAAEAQAMRRAYGPLATEISWRRSFGANLVGLSLSNFAPAPRVVNESLKGLILREVPLGSRVAAGVMMQVTTLIAVGLFSLPCGVALVASGGGVGWLWAALVHAVLVSGAGFGLLHAARFPKLLLWLRQKRPHWNFSPYEEIARQGGALGATGWLVLARVFQTASLGVAGLAVGIDVGPLRALAAEGVQLLAGAAFVFIPGGLGATDGAFALAAEALGTDVPGATAMALVMRAVQVVWTGIGFAVFVGLRRGARARGH